MNLYGGLTARGQDHGPGAPGWHYVTRDCLQDLLAGLAHVRIVPTETPLLGVLHQRVNAEGAKLKADMLASIGRWSGE
jgi:hypothetical protein